MNHLPLEALACLEVRPLGHVGSVLVNVVAQALLYNSCVKVSSSLSSGNTIDDNQWEVQALKARFRTETHRRCRVAKEGFSPLGRGEYPYDVE
jgi:hypothetical protein